jgi:hypothetical protein
MCGKANEGAETSERARAGHPSLLRKIIGMEISRINLYLTEGENIGTTERKNSEHID